MDANDTNKSTTRQRDAQLARRMGEALDQLKPRSDGDCPDAEVIAAYSEQALAADGTAKCEDHFATCSRCRNILKVLAAASDAPLAETEVAQLGQRVSAVNAPVEITTGAAKPARSKAALWSTRWLAPALGIAAVLTVWFAMRPPWRAIERGSSPTLIAQAPREEMPAPVPLAMDRADKAAPVPETPSSKTAAPYSNSERAVDEKLKSKDAMRDISPTDSLAKSLSEAKKESAPLASENRAMASAASAAPPAAPPQPGVSSAMNSTAAQPRAQIESEPPPVEIPAAPNPPSGAAIQSSGQVAAAMQAAPVPQEKSTPAAAPSRQQPNADLPLNGRNFQTLSRLRPAPPTPIVLKSTSGTSLWRVGIAGRIERSSDSGKTWSPQISPSKDDWLSGVAVSDAVCWLAGRNGAIARTKNGEDWEKIAPPRQARAKDGKLPDWSVVTAQDAQSATVTASDGARFATSDGGKSWQQQ